MRSGSAARGGFIPTSRSAPSSAAVNPFSCALRASAGASGARYAALKSGAVDGSILTDPFDAQATLEGYSRLDDLLPKYLKAETYAGGKPPKTLRVILRNDAGWYPGGALQYLQITPKIQRGND